MKRKLSLIIALTLILSVFSSFSIVFAANESVTMIWNEEFDVVDRTDYTEDFVLGNFKITTNEDGTATFSTTASSWIYSRGYRSDCDKFIVEAKVSAISSPSGDSTVGTDKTALQVSAPGVYYTVVDRSGNKVDFYDEAGVKTSATTVNFGDNRLFGMYLSRTKTITFDYIRVYSVNSSLALTDAIVDGNDVIVTVGAPINADTAIFTATPTGGSGIDSTAVSVVSMAERKYRISFPSLAVGTTYTLTTKAVTGLDGTAITEATSTTFATAAAPVLNQEIYVNDFSADNSGSAFDYSTAEFSAAISNGTATVSSLASWKKFKMPFTATSKEIIVELKIDTASGGFQMGPVVGSTVTNNKTDITGAGVYYLVINGTTGKFSVYNSALTQVGTEQAFDAGEVNAISITFGKSQTFVFDYIAVYEKWDFDFELVSADRSGAVITTTQPLALTSTFKVSDGENDVTATVTKSSEAYNTYNLNFESALSYGTEYTISADSLSGIFGAISTTSTAVFETEEYVAPTYKEIVPFFLENSTSNNTYEKTYGTVLNITHNEEGTVFQPAEAKEGVVKATNVTMPTNGNYYIEYEVIEYSVAKDFRVYPAGYPNAQTTSRNTNAKFFGVFDAAEGTYSLYMVKKDGTCTHLETVTKTTTPTDLRISSNGLYRTSYIAAYTANELAVQVGNGIHSGVPFKTTAPINTSSSKAVLGSTTLSIRPVEGEICSYIATFSEETTTPVTTNETLKLTLDYLDGTEALAETEYNVTFSENALFYKSIVAAGEDTYVRGSVNVCNPVNEAKSFVYLVAAYNIETDEFEDVKIETITVPANTAGKFTTTLYLPLNADYYYRGFVWEDMKTICPINIIEE